MNKFLILLVLFAAGCGGGVSKDQLELARLEAEKAKAEAEKARADADKANASQSEQADGRPIGPPTFPPPPPPKTLQDFGKRIFAAYQSGNESELMGLTATIDDYEKWISHAKQVIKSGDFSRVEGRQKNLYEKWVSASPEKSEKEKKEVLDFLTKGKDLLSVVLKSQKTGIAALIEGNGSTQSEVVGDWKDAVFKKIHVEPNAIDEKYDDNMFGFAVEFLLGNDSYMIVFFGAGIRVNGEYFIFTIPKCFRKFKGDPPSNIFKNDGRQDD